jgi:four helix bundle protein
LERGTAEEAGNAKRGTAEELPVAEKRSSQNDLVLRTKGLALEVMRLAPEIPDCATGRIIRYQLLKCATSVGANYRAAQRGRSKADFVSKLGIVEEESDECRFWLELLAEGGLMPSSRIDALHQEATEILAMVVASIRTAKGKNGD